MKLLFFAQCADWMGRRALTLEPSRPVRLGDILRDTPALAPLAARPAAYRIAVNQVFSDIDTEVRHGDEIAFLPPFSGG